MSYLYCLKNKQELSSPPGSSYVAAQSQLRFLAPQKWPSDVPREIGSNKKTFLFNHQLKPKVCGKLLKVISKSCKKQKLNLETLTLVAILYRCQRFNLKELYEKVKELVKFLLFKTSINSYNYLFHGIWTFF